MKGNAMKYFSVALGAAAILVCTAPVMAQERAPQVPAEKVQPPAEIVVPPRPASPEVAPNRETSGAANSATRGEPPAPVPRGGKHDDEDQTAPAAAPRR